MILCGLTEIRRDVSLLEVEVQPIILSTTYFHAMNATAYWFPAGSSSRGGDVAVYVLDINQPSLPNPFYSVLVSIPVFMTLSTAFHSIDSPDNSPLSHAVLSVLFLLIGPFSYIFFVKVSLRWFSGI